MMKTIRKRAALFGSVAALTMALAACSTDADTADTADEPAATEQAADDGMTQDDSAAEGESALTLQPVGDACSQVPADGEGSSAGMADDAVATAASNNPLLETLVAAVGAADLGDTLNGLEDATVFAPINPAFEAFTEEELQGLLEDTETLTQILTLHVVPENLELSELESQGTVTTVEGSELTLDFSGEGELPSVASPGATAQVVCGNVQTANATVHLIDTVLTP